MLSGRRIIDSEEVCKSVRITIRRHVSEHGPCFTMQVVAAQIQRLKIAKQGKPLGDSSCVQKRARLNTNLMSIDYSTIMSWLKDQR